MSPILVRFRASLSVVANWWSGMSDVEKRQAQQRAVSLAACAAALTVGGPLIGYRFEVQKSDEAYRAEARELADRLAAGEADWRELPSPGGPRGWMQQVSYETSSPGLSIGPEVKVRARDDLALVNLASFGARHLDLAERETLEIDCLAQAVYYEARSEDVRGQMAVAEVVMNRVGDPRFPKTICDVVYQGHYRATGCQFTFTCDGSLRHRPRGAAWARARDIALHVQLGLNTPVTHNATHYHTDYVNPYWSAGMVETTVVGTHIFYRFPKGGAEWSRARLALDARHQHESILKALEEDYADDAPDEAVDDTDLLKSLPVFAVAAEVETEPSAGGKTL
jgi:hypothetical protein